ncbi:hypothetical protein PoB_000302800 [Plakobranchus ocellatus]|uniref:Uncharacterized protein n=1 Tax=Plakobranchus ocellatus TaxID=259542 RepID=A0AAV3Y2Q3_9GAST|nr:hypothetical protein PoB_000302800 [Plakobranchus ocellatus]
MLSEARQLELNCGVTVACVWPVPRVDSQHLQFTSARHHDMGFRYPLVLKVGYSRSRGQTPLSTNMASLLTNAKRLHVARPFVSSLIQKILNLSNPAAR